MGTSRFLTRRQFLHHAALAAGGVGLAASGCTGPTPIAGPASGPAAGGRRPNILFILADDLGYGDLGCYGQKRIRTPNIDALAAGGVRFTDCYAGSTVCAPSRCCLMTGLHSGHAAIRGNALVSLGPKDVTVAEVLQRAGYATALIGKWGLGEAGSAGVPTKKGFDYFFGYLNQVHAHNYYPEFLWRGEQKVPLRNVVPKATPIGAGVASEKVEYSHDLFEREALDWVGKHKDGPFFLYWALTIPHANNEAGKAGMEVPDLGPYAAEDWPAAEKGHAAMISRMDASVGRMMARLKELGIDGNTLVIFTSDNGPHREGGHNPDFNNSRGPLRGIKRDLYEGGIRVPGIARWPGHIPAGTVSGQVWAFWDFLPTAAALAGAAPPPGLDGISFLPALAGGAGAAGTHEFLYWEFHEGPSSSQAMRMGNWKAVRKAPKGPLELYDLTKDIGEARNLAAEHPNVVRRIESYLATARTDSPAWPLRDRPATRPASRPGPAV